MFVMNSDNYGLENVITTAIMVLIMYPQEIVTFSWLSALENDLSKSSIWDSVGSQ